jgi:predicted ATPase
MRRRRPLKSKGPATYFRGPRWQPKELPDGYPFSLPAVRDLEKLRFEKPVTFLIGENGSGKSTLLEAIAIRAGFNAEGGSRNFNFSTWRSHSQLSDYIALERGFDRMRDGYFLRAESFYNVATEIKALDNEPADAPPIALSYGSRGLHEQSHGESFFSLIKNRLRGNGFYCFDEPEAALSPQRQLAMLTLMHRLVNQRGQMVIATHSPILMAYPNATIYLLDETGLRLVSYEETEHYQITRRFLTDTDQMVRSLLEDEEDLFQDAKAE